MKSDDIVLAYKKIYLFGFDEFTLDDGEVKDDEEIVFAFIDDGALVARNGGGGAKMGKIEVEILPKIFNLFFAGIADIDPFYPLFVCG